MLPPGWRAQRHSGPGQAVRPGKEAGEPARVLRHLRHGPHPLGHPRPPGGKERPPAPGLLRQARHHPQWHHRELPGDKGRAGAERHYVPIRHRLRGAGESHCRLPARRRRRRDPRNLRRPFPRGRGLRHCGDERGPPRHPLGHPRGQPAGHGHRHRRKLLRIGHSRLFALHARRGLP